ncbi:flagellar biosynthetic protein FliR [Citreimonas salinaria]|uniref:Flagellar biosynthetic protein FliR n=1 Tax=Citreimonas salinaria TaxID=321339 RepID=A0A1H3FEH8_9RHOB|nr:flagellar biosynthetic protein FliR [Citreimonas salinaria]SDX89285.1 flagellar biosynthetic protein FliR [Citreimonas salinaria]
MPIEEAFGAATILAWGSLIVFLRVAAALFALPALGEQWLSLRVRLLLAIMLTAAIVPAVLPALDIPDPSLGSFLKALVTETLAGLFMGIMLRLFVLAIQTAGSMMAQSTSLSQIMGQAGIDPLPAMGHVLTVSALALLMATGFHVKAAAYLILSYDILPPLEFPNPGAVADAGRRRVAESFALAFSLALPFVILSVLYNLTLGVINKAMPTLMVAFVGAPVITMGAVAMLFLTAPLALTVWLEAVEVFLAAPFR